VITEESQVEVCDSECASLITPPRIYIQPSFLGGGDQDLSQEAEAFIEVLPFAEMPEDTQLRQQKLFETIKVYGQLLVDAFDSGVEGVKAMLKSWTTEERWGAILELEQLAPQKLEELVAIAPDCFQWCDV
jgi:hypothetical protein